MKTFAIEILDKNNATVGLDYIEFQNQEEAESYAKYACEIIGGRSWNVTPVNV